MSYEKPPLKVERLHNGELFRVYHDGLLPSGWYLSRREAAELLEALQKALEP